MNKTSHKLSKHCGCGSMKVRDFEHAM